VLPEFKPRWNAHEGPRELYDALRVAGLRLEDFEGPRYRRISHLQELLSSGRLGADLRWRDAVMA
jgi:hypothetical protein